METSAGFKGNIDCITKELTSWNSGHVLNTSTKERRAERETERERESEINWESETETGTLGRSFISGKILKDHVVKVAWWLHGLSVRLHQCSYFSLVQSPEAEQRHSLGWRCNQLMLLSNVPFPECGEHLLKIRLAEQHIPQLFHNSLIQMMCFLLNHSWLPHTHTHTHICTYMHHTHTHTHNGGLLSYS